MFNDGKAYVTVTSGMSGFFAVHVWLNKTEKSFDKKEILPPFWEPYDTGLGRYPNIEDAIIEAKEWAADLGLNFYLPNDK